KQDPGRRACAMPARSGALKSPRPLPPRGSTNQLKRMPACESLLLLLDDVDLADALAFAPEALAGHVVAFDVNAHLALTERAVAHVTSWQIIGYDERPGVCAYEAAILDFWRRRAVMPYRGLNLLAMAEYRHLAA